MNKIIYNSDTIKIMVLFETLTNSKLKDCIVNEDKMLFIVEEGEASKAIVNNGINAKNLQKALKRKIKITEFSDDLIKFINNLIYPIQAKEIKKNQDTLMISTISNSDRGILIGKNAANLRILENVIKRFFDIKEIRIC